MPRTSTINLARLTGTIEIVLTTTGYLATASYAVGFQATDNSITMSPGGSQFGSAQITVAANDKIADIVKKLCAQALALEGLSKASGDKVRDFSDTEV